jgi:hypothetical protein
VLVPTGSNEAKQGLALKTFVISLYGGPGCGKSTLAAELFAEYKKRGRSVELVHEWVKGWAWRGTPPKDHVDALYILAKQARAEATVYGKVETIITDSPLGLCPVYEQLYNPASSLIETTFRLLEQENRLRGLEGINIFVTRCHKYVNEGRFEEESTAKKVDDMCKELHSGFHVRGFDECVKLLTSLGRL